MRERDYEETGVGLLNDGAVYVRRAALNDSVQDGRAAAFFAPRAYKRLNDEGQQVLGALQSIAAQIHEMQGHLDEHVLEARELGASWDLIAWSVGTTGEGARKRWGS
jgi:hypothetical protein